MRNQRAQGRPGASSHPRSACIKGSTRQNHRWCRIIRPSLRNGFNGYFVLSPGDRALLPPSLSRNCVPRKLSASVGAPGPHDFAVRLERRSSCVAKASTASRPTFVTTRTPLLPRRDGGNNIQFLIFRKRNICAWRTDDPNRIESAHEIRLCAHAFWRCLRPSARRERRRIDQTDSPVGSLFGTLETCRWKCRLFGVDRQWPVGGWNDAIDPERM
jgi:hypothetical protein